ncbi:MAG TPA: DUF1189 family protein [Bacteroidia bacterium]|jgi:ABC-type sugar transport system permease subunit
MGNYPFFKKVVLSFFSKKLYIYSARAEGNKTGLGYLILLLCIFWIPLAIKLHLSFSYFIDTELPPFIGKVPVIEIHDGVASFDKPSPYIITDEKTGRDAIIFDESGEYTSLENTDAEILVTDSKIIYKKGAYETREYSLKEIKNFSLTHEKIISWAGYGKYISILIYLLIIPCVFVYRAFLALIYTLIGLIFQAILQTKFSFQTIYRLSILAFTPAFIIDKVFMISDLDFTGWSFCCMVLSLAYLYFAIKVNKDEDIANSALPPELGTNYSGGNSGI